MIILQRFLLTTLFITPLLAAQTFNNSDLELDTLMGMDVQTTSAMKRAQSAFDTASSIYVLNKEQISQSGATSVPEALKMVPGLIVRQLDNNQWAISSRGVASRFSSKLLVMIDGQSLYSPQFAAVYWEALNVPLYDIERIEVIRGQGGLLWGSNANNGVINIITKNSLDTRGGYTDATTGSQVNSDVNFRYGDDISRNGSYRIYGHLNNTQASKRESIYRDNILTANDTKKQYSLGFRTDFTPSNNWNILFQGDITHSKLSQNLRAAVDETNRNIAFTENFKRTDSRLMARIDSRISTSANQMLQVSWLKQRGTEIYLKEDFESLDIDYQMNFIHNSLQLDWGLSYRYNDVVSKEGLLFNYDKGIEHLKQYGGLLQLQYDLIPEKLALIVGTKLDHNDLTGWENQPSARFTYKLTKKHLAWGAVSRSVRIPALLEYDYNFKVSGTETSKILQTTTGIAAIDEYRVATFLNGNDKVESEKYLSYELGYRFSDANWSVDFSAYRTDAKDVVVFSTDPTDQVAQFFPVQALLQAGKFTQAAQVLTTTQLNLDLVAVAEAKTDGLDLVFAWQALDTLNTELGYSYTDFTYDLPPNTIPTIGYDSINRQVFAKANYTPLNGHNILAVLRSENSSAYGTNSYTALDLTWNWQINSQWLGKLSAKNLFADSHLEFHNTNEAYTIPTYIDKSISLTIAMTF